MKTRPGNFVETPIEYSMLKMSLRVQHICWADGEETYSIYFFLHKNVGTCSGTAALVCRFSRRAAARPYATIARVAFNRSLPITAMRTSEHILKLLPQRPRKNTCKAAPQNREYPMRQCFRSVAAPQTAVIMQKLKSQTTQPKQREKR